MCVCIIITLTDQTALKMDEVVFLRCSFHCLHAVKCAEMLELVTDRRSLEFSIFHSAAVISRRVQSIESDKNVSVEVGSVHFNRRSFTAPPCASMFTIRRSGHHHHHHYHHHHHHHHHYQLLPLRRRRRPRLFLLIPLRSSSIPS